MAGKKIRKQVLAGMVILLVMLALLPVASGAEEIPMKWYKPFPLVASAGSSPAIGPDGTIYVGSADYENPVNSKLYAINPDGTEKWAFPAKNWVDASPAVGDDGTVYIGLSDFSDEENPIYYLCAINPDDAKEEQWRFSTSGVILSSPAIGVDGTIYVATSDSNPYDDIKTCFLYALNPDGNKKWEFPFSGKIDSSPVIGKDGIIYVGTDWTIYERLNVIHKNSKLYAINPDGTQKWAFPSESENKIDSIISSPAIGSDGTIYVGTTNSDPNDNVNTGYLYAVNPDGTQKWAFPSGRITHSSPVIAVDGTIYIGTDEYVNSKLYAVNPDDGTPKWTFPSEGNLKESINISPAIGADGMIYIGCGYDFYVINPDGTLKQTLFTSYYVISSPSIDTDGTIYTVLGDENGDCLYAIKSDSGGLANSSWAMFGHDARHTGRVSEEPSCPDPVKIIKGTVLRYDDNEPLCAMVLANGQHIFSCDGDGKYELVNVPLDDNGQITLFAFCDGLKPFKTILTRCDEIIETDISMEPESEPKEMSLTREETTVLDSGWVKISGTATYEGMPLNMMVLANGQYMFTSSENGKYELTVPLDANGEITLFGFCDGLQPFKEIF